MATTGDAIEGVGNKLGDLGNKALDDVAAGLDEGSIEQTTIDIGGDLLNAAVDLGSKYVGDLATRVANKVQMATSVLKLIPVATRVLKPITVVTRVLKPIRDHPFKTSANFLDF